jgi:ligand-binding sensor domain-containing protein
MGGLFQYNRDNDTFIHFAHDPTNPSSLSSNNITNIQDDDDGNVWVGTEYGLNLFDGTRNIFQKFFSTPADTASISHNFVTDILFSTKKELWVTTQSGLNRLVKSKEKYSFERYYYPENSRPSDLENFIFQITELNVDGNPTIWFSTMRGLFKWYDGKLEAYTVQGKPSQYSFIRCIAPVNGPDPFIIVGSEMGLHFFDVKSNSFK